jgi:hypothetical protein
VRNLLTDVPGVTVAVVEQSGVYEATALPYKTAVPDWKTRFGGGRR